MIDDGYSEVLYSLYMFQSCHYEKSKATIIQVEWALLKYHKLKKMNIKIPRAKNKNVCKLRMHDMILDTKSMCSKYLKLVC